MMMIVLNAVTVVAMMMRNDHRADLPLAWVNLLVIVGVLVHSLAYARNDSQNHETETNAASGSTSSMPQAGKVSSANSKPDGRRDTIRSMDLEDIGHNPDKNDDPELHLDDFPSELPDNTHRRAS
jgi:hypothetical protein